jgi:DNA invertase Pin-like site-specific DNA recombinase
VIQSAIAYGRKSFDDPDERTLSVDDQKLFAEAYARSHGLNLIGFYGDDGITGATMERPGLQAMLRAVACGEAKVVIIEDVDRLGRDQDHLQHMIKLFRVHDVVIHTVAAGRIDDLVFAFKGIIGEQQRMRIAYTTRRGLKGKASRGGATGGRVLGYGRVVTGQDAQGREMDCLGIDEEQAALVRCIFQLYADGQSLQQICNTFDAEGLPSPRARERGKYNAGIWNPSILSGDVTLGKGILNNEIYIGRRIFNRRLGGGPQRTPRFLPQATPDPEAEWVLRDEPSLPIIEQSLWDAVKVRQADVRFARTRSSS